ncbi:TATA-box-binding protein [Folsomia candida]|uniref:TATA-box-binding protein n=1 Tax=Folsomia candida TaxID=158441 RepID=A0A226CZY6_FOLCA|nr:TATA-box-binding protein [Folsomia candida]OXA38885.1 TATA-box-binding protein [Folsomia candida]
MATQRNLAVKDEPKSPDACSLDDFEDGWPPNKLVRVDSGNYPILRGQDKRKRLRKECLEAVKAENQFFDDCQKDGLAEGNLKGKRKSARKPSLVATETARKLPLRAARRIGTGGEGDPPSFVPCNLPRQRPAFEVSPAIFEANGILGNGKGTVYPKYELDSQYNFIIPEPHKLKNAPWKQSPIEPPEGLEPTVLSVVASVNLGADLDLKAIADGCLDLSYNPESFAPLVMRLKDPIATAMIFPAGRMTVSGAKSVEACKIAVRKFTAMVRSVGFNVRPFGMLIKNISATFSVGFKIRLRHLSKNRMLTPQITYEPDSFTGVSMALPFPKANVMVFRTGSGMIQGVTTFKDLDKVFKIIYPHLKMYAM